MAVNETAFLHYLKRRRRNFLGTRSSSSGKACPGLNHTCFATEACYIMHLSDAAAAKCAADVCHTTPMNSTSLVYTVTSGIKWCSGGGDYKPAGDIFGAGIDGNCPLIPEGWTMDQAAVKCEDVCTSVSECVGFTLYPKLPMSTTDHAPKECCFRTGSVASQPPMPGSQTRCYAKPAMPVVCGIPR